MLAGLEPADLPADAIEVGRILGSWGLKGWLKAAPYSASPEALFASKRWYLQAPEQGPKRLPGTWLLRIQQAREQGASVVFQVQDIDDPDLAASLKGGRIFIPRTSFPTAGPDEYYWVDLIGLDVINREGVALGKVKDLLSTGPQTVLVLAQENAAGEPPTERMVPFVSAYIDGVDLAARRITVDWQADY